MNENETTSSSTLPDMPSGESGDTPPDIPSGESGGTPPDMSSGGSSSSSVSYSATTSITSAGNYSEQTYNSSTADQNAILVSLSSGTVNLVNPTVTKTGDSDGGDNSNFYGTNSAILATGGGTVSITGGTITADATGANGVFSYGGNGGQNGAAGDGTTVIISDTTIKTTGSNGGGIMTTGGGITKASNLTITTTGNSSAAIRSDRGGGTVSVSGGSYTSNGLGSPAVYSTADITIENATLISNLSEGVCIEGKNSVSLNDCTLTAHNLKTNGNAQFLDAVILYQSQSGDSASGTATFSMTGGTITNTSGHIFHVTNTAAVINLENVTINDSGDGVLLSVCDDGWSGASNVATLNANNQTLDGDILVGNDSTLTLNISDSSTFTGNISGNINNNAGTSISTSVGTVNVSLDSSSKWYLEGDAYITSFSGTAANVITGGHTLYVNNSPLSGTTENEDTTPSSVTTALNIANSVNNTLIEGTSYDDTISSTGNNVTILGGAGDDQISIGSAQVFISYSANDGNDTIWGFGENSSLSIDGEVYTSVASGNDVIIMVGDNSINLKDARNNTTNIIIGESVTSGGSSTSTQSGGSSTSTQSGGSSTSTQSGGSSTSTQSGGSSTSTQSGGSSTSTQSGGSSTSTQSGGSSTSTQSGGSSTSTQSGGSSTSTQSGGSSTSTQSGGSSTSTQSGGSSTSTQSGGSSASIRNIIPSTTDKASSSVASATSETVNSSDTPVVKYIYAGGDEVVSNYTSGQKIALGTYPTSGNFVDGNFVLSSSSGDLVIQNAANKVIDLVDGTGKAFAKAYWATNPGVIDGRGLAGYEIIAGSDAGADLIFAGDDGSQLWGGAGIASDTLIGGGGTDIFVGGKYQGTDVFGNASTADVIYLNDATLGDIIATSEQNGVIAVAFNTGNVIAAYSSQSLSSAFVLADGSAWRFNHVTKSWQSA